MITFKRNIPSVYFITLVVLVLFVLSIVNNFALADTTGRTTLSQGDSVNPTLSSFSLTSCDGPDLSKAPEALASWTAKNPNKTYVVCNFNGAVGQINRLISAAIVLAVLIAIIGFSYAGYLYITGVPGNIEKAKEIFKKVFIGFVIMVCAWFIVYQILVWLTGTGSTATYLLGSKS